MTVVHNWNEDKSQFKMWDAKKMTDNFLKSTTPVVTANMRERVPFGFHTTFVE